MEIEEPDQYIEVWMIYLALLVTLAYVLFISITIKYH